MTTIHQSRIFLLDENIPKKVLSSLRIVGYKATRVHDERLSSHPDSAIFVHARAQHMTIITFNTDYLDSTKFPPPRSGILVLRFFPRGSINTLIANAVLHAAKRLNDLDISSHVYTVTPDNLEETY